MLVNSTEFQQKHHGARNLQKYRAQRQHFMTRVRERYGIQIDADQYETLVHFIKQGKAKLIAREEEFFAAYWITMTDGRRRRRIKVLFDHSDDTLVTAFPPQGRLKCEFPEPETPVLVYDRCLICDNAVQREQKCACGLHLSGGIETPDVVFGKKKYNVWTCYGNYDTIRRWLFNLVKREREKSGLEPLVPDFEGQVRDRAYFLSLESWERSPVDNWVMAETQIINEILRRDRTYAEHRSEVACEPRDLRSCA